MNQIEFIKEFAKEDDRIVDEGSTFICNENFGIINLSNWVIRSLADIKLQSPKIYRMISRQSEGFLATCKVGYVEAWELVADYAYIENQDKHKLDILRDLRDQINAFNINFISLDKRLKAIEDKLK